LISHLHDELLPQLCEVLNDICNQHALRMPTTLKEAVTLSELLDDIEAIQQRYRLEVFEQPLDNWVGTLDPVRGAPNRFFARLFNSSYRDAINMLKTYRNGMVDEARLRGEVIELHDVLLRWRTCSTGPSTPKHYESQAKLHACIQDLKGVAELKEYLPKQRFMSLPLNEAEAVVQILSADAAKARQLPRVREVQRRLNELKLAPLLRAFDQQHIPENLWGPAFEFALYNSCLDWACEGWPELSAFSGNTHQQIVQSFKALDEERIKLAAGRIKRAHAENALQVRNDHPEENTLIKSQAQKKRNRLQLRELLSRTPHVSTALFPCWMTSPLSISQLLKADQRYFDIVIFDEASQILPEDAVPAIMRADHVVVAGDRHQLPPTTFFAASTDDDIDAEEDSVDGYESVLDQLAGLTEYWSLDWHYRSKDESLIAFSNKHIYQGRMTTFPNAIKNAAIRHVLVTPAVLRDGDVDSVTAEVNQVVDLVMEHAEARPNETLGVITMGIKHAERIERAIEDRLAFHPELEYFFDRTRRERFFVKNLERVQGDERDAIILSIGYGKDASGRLPYRFGPLLFEGGERRLNVAVTRARSRLTLVSSFSADDMDPTRSSARGVELLRLYLHYAASQGKELGQSQSSSNFPLNPFEADVYDALHARDVKLSPQWGVSNYRIDFAVQHPEHPGKFVLAIECDGASYHSAPTARDRDRLRQQVLESLGWRFHRIWSTDWFNHREREIQRALDAIQAACELHSTEASSNGKSSDSMVHAIQVFENQATITVQPRTRMPFMPDGRAIDAYPMEYLVAMVRWVQSDGKLRDDDELFEEVFSTLGYRRRGDKINTRIRQAIARSKK
jgi:very-short-patch-repair endonuclease